MRVKNRLGCKQTNIFLCHWQLLIRSDLASLIQASQIDSTTSARMLPPLPPESSYTRCYCEENIYLLCKAFSARPEILEFWSVYVVFISNENKTVSDWCHLFRNDDRFIEDSSPTGGIVVSESRWQSRSLGLSCHFGSQVQDPERRHQRRRFRSTNLSRERSVWLWHHTFDSMSMGR